jgi:hypothetical protein
MDFYLNPRNDSLRIDSPAHLLLQATDLNVAIYLHTESSETIGFDINPERAYSNVRALKEIDAVIENVQNLCAVTLHGMDTRDLSSTTVR